MIKSQDKKGRNRVATGSQKGRNRVATGSQKGRNRVAKKSPVKTQDITEKPRTSKIIDKLNKELESLSVIFTKHCKQCAEKYGVDVQITIGFEVKPPFLEKGN